jgi:hypothetical protein
MRPAERGVGPATAIRSSGSTAATWSIQCQITWVIQPHAVNGTAKVKPTYPYRKRDPLFRGPDPDRLDFLGAELEHGMGKDNDRHIFNRPTVVVCARRFPISR